ncbi:acyl carrier protein [Paenibacillus sp. SYP-B3998]|uniref:Acyl carrier protein n=1 Tax=Paenibacillus sp. SYP-B3998 TaxID=2678564 RepID=A0A6G3ZX41_9BACL|nr:phosphopantetheine-binding protein [Paenibacillus sp. SYP-B3998]NEW06274.1 acyl carrier protein [Paenibacillus sp. SYP-B3998]
MTPYEKIAGKVGKVLNLEAERMVELSGDEALNTIGMDSINCMEIVVEIEEEFEITFSDDELLLESLNSLNKLTAIVEQKLSEHSLT